MSNSIGVPMARSLGQRKKTPEELISRVTKVMGYCSRTPATLRSCSGSRSEARGLSRCSLWTPTAWVGTRTNCRGAGCFSRGMTRSAGTPITAGSCGNIGLWIAGEFTLDCEGKSSQSNARLAAAISPLSERKSHNVTDEVGEATDFNLSPRNRGATGWSK